MRPIELLSPARNLECGIEAIRHGADAVYIGAPRFGARAAAGNSIEDIAALVRFANPYGVKIYVTVNTLLYDEELPAVDALIGELQAAGVDALIVQDERLMTLNHGRLPLHSSTQMDNRTIADVRARQAAGYKQTVLARELSLEDIRAIHDAVPEMPLEAFVHGALCVSYSGRCYASEYCFGRSANRGECAQFCRLPFDLIDADGKVLEKQRHLLSLKDMNRSADLEAMMDVGITSFKIEGRLKDVSYVKNITAYYRQQIDAILARRPQDYCRASLGTSTITFTPNPLKSFNRGFTDYFLHGRTREPIHQPLTPKSLGEQLGPYRLTIAQEHNTPLPGQGGESFHNGDGLCFFTPDGQLHGFRVNSIDAQGRIHPADPSVLKILRPDTPLYRNFDAYFEHQLARPTADRRIPIRWLLEDHEIGFRLTLTIKETGVSVSSTTYVQELEPAHTPQADNIRRQLMRLGDTPYTCTADDIEIRFSDNWFIPASVLGEWRREVVNKVNAPTPNRPTPSPSREGRREAGAKTSRGQESLPSRGDLEGSAGVPLMTCRHCLRYALGYCTRDGQRLPYREPLYLRLADGRTFPLHFDCKACEMQVLKSKRVKRFSHFSLFTLLFFTLLFSSCYNPPQHIILDAVEASADSTSQRISRPYGIGYNLLVQSDSLLLVEDRPMHWSEGVIENSDSLWVQRHDQIVIAAMTVIPEDSVDSVWIKVARDQETMGWLHENELINATTPDDPISQFINFFSDVHVLWFLIIVGVAVGIGLVHLLRRQRFRMIHVNDIPTVYPTLLTCTLALSAWLYGLIQYREPQMWVQFYYHPTLNPFEQPLMLCTFLCTVWALFLLTLATLDDVLKMLQTTEAILYFLSLMAVCMVLYLTISITPVIISAILAASYIIFALYRYIVFARPRYLCGRCGQRLQQKGKCPYCSAINE